MHILSTVKIRAFAEAVACLEPCSWTGKIEPDQIKIMLGEVLDVWAASIIPGLDEDDLVLPQINDGDLVLPEFKDEDLVLPELTEADLVPPEFWNYDLVLPDPGDIDLSGLDTSLDDVFAEMDKLPS